MYFPAFTITLANKDFNVCHAGLDPASNLLNGYRLVCLGVFAGMTGIQLPCRRYTNIFSGSIRY